MTTVSPSPSRPPLLQRASPVDWCRENLFSNWFSGIVTVLTGMVFLTVIRGFWTWSTTEAQWRIIPANFHLLLAGRFPAEQYWRLWILLSLLSFLAGVTWGWLARRSPTLFQPSVLIALAVAAIILTIAPAHNLVPPQLLSETAEQIAMDVGSPTARALARVLNLSQLGLILTGSLLGRLWDRLIPRINLNLALPIAWPVAFLISLWLIRGGLGLAVVSTSDWSGLLLTVFLALVSIILCFPLGVLLALGRQSSLPAIRWLSTLHIEVIRGVPLIAILFMGQVMIPLFLPEGMRPDRVLRAIVGLTLFSAAYMAENIRGGLQAIPQGQIEAASALGLSSPLTVGLIVLPQALKISIPSIVGQFISLFQDTTLLSIVGLLELLGLSRAVLANPDFVGRSAEIYCFIGLLYWGFCYAMSLGSRRLEQVLNTEHR